MRRQKVHYLFGWLINNESGTALYLLIDKRVPTLNVTKLRTSKTHWKMQIQIYFPQAMMHKLILRVFYLSDSIYECDNEYIAIKTLVISRRS